MELDSRATNWHACFDETRRMLIEVGKKNKDDMLAKYHALQLIEVEEAQWTDYFHDGKWFVDSGITKMIGLFDSYKPDNYISARPVQDSLALRLYNAPDEHILFSYATLSVSKELANARRPYARLMEKGLYVCFYDDLPMMLPKGQ